MRLADLHTTSPYKGFKPAKYPSDVFGWGSDDPIFDQLIEHVRPSLIIEVGSWLGASAIHMANACKSLGLSTTIVCIDTWLGSLEMWADKSDETRYGALNLVHGYPTLYYSFLANVMRAGHSDCVIPFPQTSLIAARWFAQMGVQADLIYVDASHDYSDVLADLRAFWPLVRPGGVMFGDDLNTFVDVDRALDRFAGESRLQATKGERFWHITK
ncbi:MAG: class I SAM-dependent methyltransferase [Kouleothrix sp.]|jgi:cephalosporin hydroxylase|nr:class I SAM-dependent methyltransferase [Kouleothrix sp.]